MFPNDTNQVYNAVTSQIINWHYDNHIPKNEKEQNIKKIIDRKFYEIMKNFNARDKYLRK